MVRAICKDVTFTDYPTLDDCAIIVYFAGCEHNCEDCQNELFQDSASMRDTYTDSDLLDVIYEKCLSNFTDKVVLSGGDPLHENNRAFVKMFCEETDLDVMIYTGYEKWQVDTLGLKGYRYLKTGKFETNNRNNDKLDSNTHFILASQNQELWDSDGNLLTKDGIYVL